MLSFAASAIELSISVLMIFSSLDPFMGLERQLLSALEMYDFLYTPTIPFLHLLFVSSVCYPLASGAVSYTGPQPWLHVSELKQELAACFKWAPLFNNVRALSSGQSGFSLLKFSSPDICN